MINYVCTDMEKMLISFKNSKLGFIIFLFQGPPLKNSKKL